MVEGYKPQDFSFFHRGGKLVQLYSVFGINAGIIDKAMLASIRFSYNAERCMKNRVSQLKKSQNKEGLAALWDYSNAIQDISFEDGNPLNRLLRTFDLFKNYYHISARLDYEKLYGSFGTTDFVRGLPTQNC